jgi:hypothetical protein
MKNLLALLGAVTFVPALVFAQTTSHPAKCGMQKNHESLFAQNPNWTLRFADQRNSLQYLADYYLQYKHSQEEAEEKTTAVSAIPVIFHIIVDSLQFNNLGGTAGIIKRCDSQIAVLNEDFNKQNKDSILIPTGWRSVYGGAGIHFGLARKDPAGACSPGYEIKIIPGTTLNDAGFSNIMGTFSEAKSVATGLASWDVSSYYNVWCFNFNGGASGILGATIYLSETGTGGYPLNQEGVCIQYNVLGSTGPSGVAPPGTGGWYHPFNLGRTLTHETGHFFELLHTWGDDFGQCTWICTDTVGTSICFFGVGHDDGLSDTPPQSDAAYGNPAFTIAGGTFNDCCKMHDTLNTQPLGIACLSYMDYTDDNAMHLFTTMQAAAMAAMVLVPPATIPGPTGIGTIGENYSLTQHPDLLVPCSPGGIAPSPTDINSCFNIYPNPNYGQIHISLNSAVEDIKAIEIISTLGQQIMKVAGMGRDYYLIDLSGVSKGVYFVRCHFASGVVTRKILIQ